MKKKSFTLVEIMIVVAIIAILAAIAVPSLTQNRESAMKQTKVSNCKLVEAAIVQVLANDPTLIRSGATKTLVETQLGVTLESLTVGGEKPEIQTNSVTYVTA